MSSETSTDEEPSGENEPSAGREPAAELADPADEDLSAAALGAPEYAESSREADSEPRADVEFDDEVATIEEDEFDFQDEGDSANTKLDLARAYIDMGDADGAQDILREVMEEGNSEQRQQAQSLLDSL